jgi:hypothetical protein
MTLGGKGFSRFVEANKSSRMSRFGETDKSVMLRFGEAEAVRSRFETGNRLPRDIMGLLFAYSNTSDSDCDAVYAVRALAST